MVGAVALALVGCMPQEEPPEPTPSSTPTPSYSDAELLEQARETYEGYMAAFAEMVAADEIDYTVLLPYVTVEVATDDAAQEADLNEAGFHSVGTMTLLDISLAESETDSEIAAFACLDVTTVVFVNESGEDVTPDRPDVVAVSLAFERQPDGTLLVSRQGPPSAEQEAQCVGS